MEIPKTDGEKKIDENIEQYFTVDQRISERRDKKMKSAEDKMVELDKIDAIREKLKNGESASEEDLKNLGMSERNIQDYLCAQKIISPAELHGKDLDRIASVISNRTMDMAWNEASNTIEQNVKEITNSFNNHFQKFLNLSYYKSLKVFGAIREKTILKKIRDEYLSEDVRADESGDEFVKPMLLGTDIEIRWTDRNNDINEIVKDLNYSVSNHKISVDEIENVFERAEEKLNQKLS